MATSGDFNLAIDKGLGIVALFLTNPFPEGGLSTSHRTNAPLDPC
jgi:hypothetical protein